MESPAPIILNSLQSSLLGSIASTRAWDSRDSFINFTTTPECYHQWTNNLLCAKCGKYYDENAVSPSGNPEREGDKQRAFILQWFRRYQTELPLFTIDSSAFISGFIARWNTLVDIQHYALKMSENPMEHLSVFERGKQIGREDKLANHPYNYFKYTEYPALTAIESTQFQDGYCEGYGR